MRRLSLSNLGVRANLVAYDSYQQDIETCSVLEYKDARERLPNLLTRIPPALAEEWRGILFWGDRLPDPVDPRWPDRYAGDLAKAVPALEERATEEAVFEALVVCRQVYAGQPDDDLRGRAADWDGRLRAVLEREFRLTDEMAERRLESILGRAIPGPPRPPAPPPAPAGATAGTGGTAPARPARATGGRKAASTPDLFTPVAAAPPPVETAAGPDPDLARVTGRWPNLPDHVRKCILLLVDAAERTAPPE